MIPTMKAIETKISQKDQTITPCSSKFLDVCGNVQFFETVNPWVITLLIVFLLHPTEATIVKAG